MSRLIIVDQSLKGLGGHHFDYVLQISQAAAHQGIEVVVVAHQHFKNHSSLQHFSRIIPHFRQTTYSRYSLLAGLRTMHRRPPLLVDSPSLRPFVPEEQGPTDAPTSSEHAEEMANLALRRPGKRLSQTWAAITEQGWRSWRALQTMANRFQDFHGRNQAVKTFANDCIRVFPSLVLMPTDHVFFTTVNDLELAGLLNYWMGAPESYLPRWHLQFHFDAFQGRPPEYRKQYRVLDPLRCLFEDIDGAVPTHQLHYYATTAAIADQYQRLATRPITELAYPISEAFRLSKTTPLRVVQGIEPSASVDLTRTTDVTAKMLGHLGEHESGRIRTMASTSHCETWSNSSQNFPVAPLWTPQANGIPIVVAGGVRSEKGQKGLQEIWPELKRQVLDPGLGFIVCQRKEDPKWYRRRFSVVPAANRNEIDVQVQYVPHPLSTSQYQALIRQAGIGLLTYDPRSYANRRAGIFGEYLASGVPTLVPAGTWMADQLAKHQFTYHQQVLKENTSLACWSHSNFDWTPWNVPTASGSITFDGSEVPAYAWSPTLPPTNPADSATRLLSLRFHWVWPKEAGTFCRIEILYYDQQRQVIGTDSETVGQLGHHTAQSALFRVPAQASHFRLGLKNAFHDRNATIQRLLVDVVNCQAQTPLGSVGLMYDSLSQLPIRLSEMCTHHTHYRHTASALADSWFQQHDPTTTVTQLLSVDSHARSWVA